jgi:hypothetical protein
MIEWSQQVSDARSEMPTFRANLPSSFFMSTLHYDSSMNDEREELVEKCPKKVNT